MSKSSTCAKDLKKVLAAARAQGWRIQMGGKHLRLYPPDKTQPPATVGVSPSPSAFNNIVADLRKRGLKY